MADKVLAQNRDFFKKKAAVNTKDNVSEKTAQSKKAVKNRISDEVRARMNACADLLKKAGFKELSDELLKALRKAERDSFAVAVAGEFSRGKSTFINRLIGQDILPVGDLPTTCALTRVRYSKTPKLAVFSEKGQKISERPLKEQSWYDLVADNFGESDEFNGTVAAGADVPWLLENGIELYDTPGAGDLRDERLNVIEDALIGCDGAVITVDANAPLSLSEKLFIEERLISRKIPFLMLIITKLDRINMKERAGVIRYIIKKLEAWNMDIPVFVPYDVEIDDPELSGIIGMDKVRAQIEEWTTWPERVNLTRDWLFARAQAALENAAAALYEQKRFLEEADRKKLDELMAQKQKILEQAKDYWQGLRDEMDARYGQCADLLEEKTAEYSGTMTERLRYEAGHTNNPQKWWNEDFPYRLKIEMSNMAGSVENVISRQINQDALWYSEEINKAFRTHVVFKKDAVFGKEDFESSDVGGNIEIKSLDRQKRIAKVAGTVVSISGVALCSSMGIYPMFASMGIGTGTSIISEMTFQKKIESQKADMKKELEVCVPEFVEKSTRESKRRLFMIYDDMIREAMGSEERWLAAQENALLQLKTGSSDKKYETVSANLEKIEAAKKKIKEQQ